MKNLSLLGVGLLSLTLLAACSSTNSATKDSGSKEIKVSSSSSKAKPKTNSVITATNELAANSKSTGEIYVTGTMTVGDSGTIKPGIYDLHITGGDGNIQGERKSVNGLYLNWIGGAPGNENNASSIFRIILMDGDTVEFRDIAKVNFVAVPEKVTPTTQLGQGEYVVGRDIPAGNYKLSTNVQLDPSLSNSGWDISIYDDSKGSESDQQYNPSSPDVAVSLKEGQIISTSFDGVNPTTQGSYGDTAKLIFTAMK
ncbi:hypothetical protein [Lactococcus allomyrinae]|uniref:hypothetical protein n=1 Tax=Lactococcus allomyrinae TaxID=2419773 RepID=UPI0019693EA5|nr:hypothetical protein [Lactococcus allomyrinae]